jgi:hypothetical protein
MALVPAPVAAPKPTADIRGDYELAERVGTKEAWDSFITAYPSGFYSDLAKAQRNKLAAEAVRLAATEKARAAAEAQARLAAEGAKASEQARAAAQSKAAEDARLAAERNKQAEDAKVALALQAKAAAQAKATEEQRVAAEKARLAQEIQRHDDEAKAAAAAQAKKPDVVATAEQPKPNEPAAEKPRDQAVAALPPADQAKDQTKASTSDQPAAPDIPRLLQSELKRVGCNAGEVNGEWNAPSRRALGSFNKSAGTDFDVKVASLDALDAVRGKAGRVCPLDCDSGYRAKGDHCVKIVCDDDEVLGSNGACHPRPERRAKPVARRASGSKCFSFNGTSVCQ